MTDPIGDMITRIRNAAAVHKESLTLPYSKLKEAILTVLVKEGYVKAIEKKGKGIAKILKVDLLYVNERPRITGMERISKFSARKYAGAKDLVVVKGGAGISILTTPKGILTDQEAKKENVGGELILKAW